MSIQKAFKFSVIIPTYNRASALNRCLKSLVDQTYKNFEVLVCDDGSTDNTKEVVDGYKDVLAIRYFYAPNWGGPARPRNLGIREAVADWVCFLDSDDWYTEDKLEKIALLNLEDLDLVYHTLTMVKDNELKGTIRCRELDNGNPYDLLFNLNAIPTSSAVIRKDFLVKCGGFSEMKEIVGVEDFDLWIRLGLAGMRSKYIPLSLGFYYFGTDSITFFDERQLERYSVMYNQYLNSARSSFDKKRITGALDYQIARMSLSKKILSKSYPYFFKALYNGSRLIKMKSAFYLIYSLKFLVKR